ncbi:MAG: hypothetical protein ACREEM_29155, partial [Blastocatellia bacterium]
FPRLPPEGGTTNKEAPTMSILVEEIIQRLDQLNSNELIELEQTLRQRAKPGQESLLLARVSEPAPRPTTLARAGRIVRRTLLFLLFLGLLAAAAVLSAYFLRTRTVATGTRTDQFQTAVRYTIEQHYYRDISRIIFDDGGDGQVICNLSPMKADRLLEERWLRGGQAVYLNLQLQSPEALGADGKPAPQSARLIYDFHRGELYVASPLHLWRTASSESQWMNDEEFNGVLARYNQ